MLTIARRRLVNPRRRLTLQISKRRHERVSAHHSAAMTIGVPARQSVMEFSDEGEEAVSASVEFLEVHQLERFFELFILP